jgi:hypothetical protein
VGLVVMVQQQFFQLITSKLGNGYMGRIDNPLHFDEHSSFFDQMANALATSQNYITGHGAAVVPAIRNLRTHVINALAAEKGNLHEQTVTFRFQGGAVELVHDERTICSVECERFMGVFNYGKLCFTIPTISTLALALAQFEIKVAHEIVSAVMGVVSASGGLMKARSRVERLVKIKSIFGKCQYYMCGSELQKKNDLAVFLCACVLCA